MIFNRLQDNMKTNNMSVIHSSGTSVTFVSPVNNLETGWVRNRAILKCDSSRLYVLFWRLCWMLGACGQSSQRQMCLVSLVCSGWYPYQLQPLYA
jgi:hypothetical protein